MAVEQNWCIGAGHFFPSSDCFMLGLVNNIDVGYNYCQGPYHDCVEACMPVSGVCTGSSGSGFSNNVIHNNHFAHVMMGMTSDGGGIYMMDAKSDGGSGCASPSTAGAGNVEEYNLIHDVNDASVQDVNGYGGQGIYLDSCSGGVTVTNNVLYRINYTVFKMTNGPQSAGLAETFSNNVIGGAHTDILGVQKCPDNVTPPILQFNFTHNLVYWDKFLTGSTQYGTAYFGYTSAPTGTQNYASNSSSGSISFPCSMA